MNARSQERNEETNCTSYKLDNQRIANLIFRADTFNADDDCDKINNYTELFDSFIDSLGQFMIFEEDILPLVNGDDILNYAKMAEKGQERAARRQLLEDILEKAEAPKLIYHLYMAVLDAKGYDLSPESRAGKVLGYCDEPFTRIYNSKSADEAKEETIRWLNDQLYGNLTFKDEVLEEAKKKAEELQREAAEVIRELAGELRKDYLLPKERIKLEGMRKSIEVLISSLDYRELIDNPSHILRIFIDKIKKLSFQGIQEQRKSTKKSVNAQLN